MTWSDISLGISTPAPYFVDNEVHSVFVLF